MSLTAKKVRIMLITPPIITILILAGCFNKNSPNKEIKTISTENYKTSIKKEIK